MRQTAWGREGVREVIWFSLLPSSNSNKTTITKSKKTLLGRKYELICISLVIRLCELNACRTVLEFRRKPKGFGGVKEDRSLRLWIYQALKKSLGRLGSSVQFCCWTRACVCPEISGIWRKEGQQLLCKVLCRWLGMWTQPQFPHLDQETCALKSCWCLQGSATGGCVATQLFWFLLFFFKYPGEYC